MPAKYKLGGEESELEISSGSEIVYNNFGEKTRIVVMSEKLSDNFYVFNNKPVFSNAVVYSDGDTLNIEYKNGDYCVVDGKEIALERHKASARAGLKKCKPFYAKYSRYLFSRAKKNYYEMRADKLVFDDNIADYRLEFSFEGSSLQMYSNGELVNDFYNIEGEHIMSLKYFKNELGNSKPLKIVCAPFTKGHKIYKEKDFEFNNASLKAVKLTPIFKTSINI